MSEYFNFEWRDAFMVLLQRSGGEATFTDKELQDAKKLNNSAIFDRVEKTTTMKIGHL